MVKGRGFRDKDQESEILSRKSRILVKRALYGILINKMKVNISRNQYDDVNEDCTLLYGFTLWALTLTGLILHTKELTLVNQQKHAIETYVL